MFAVGDQVVQVIGPTHHVRLCTKLSLQHIKAAAAAGHADAQEAYAELTTGSGVLLQRCPVR